MYNASTTKTVVDELYEVTNRTREFLSQQRDILGTPEYWGDDLATVIRKRLNSLLRSQHDMLSEMAILRKFLHKDDQSENKCITIDLRKEVRHAM